MRAAELTRPPASRQGGDVIAHMHRGGAGRASTGCRSLCGHRFTSPPVPAQPGDERCGGCLVALALDDGHACDSCPTPTGRAA